MAEPTTVFVLMPNDYDQYGVYGVYSTLEKAQAVSGGRPWEGGDGYWQIAREYEIEAWVVDSEKGQL